MPEPISALTQNRQKPNNTHKTMSLQLALIFFVIVRQIGFAGGKLFSAVTDFFEKVIEIVQFTSSAGAVQSPRKMMCLTERVLNKKNISCQCQFGEQKGKELDNKQQKTILCICLSNAA
ncbi:hypothetical protein niasHT_039730 [Heterodera trifolii]|uniref:Uncharacterized protein n=1 Tax=Heterodera trifolii TaxID=157864 RepID=A0ABD2IU82_9BILA